MPVVLSMPNTADFCVLTARSLYSFYPVTTGRRVNLLLEICSGQPSTIKYMVGLRSYETTANWLEPCGEACPAVFRLTCGLKGVSVMRLTDHRKGEPNDFDPEVWKARLDCSIFGHAALRHKVILVYIIENTFQLLRRFL